MTTQNEHAELLQQVLDAEDNLDTIQDSLDAAEFILDEVQGELEEFIKARDMREKDWTEWDYQSIDRSLAWLERVEKSKVQLHTLTGFEWWRVPLNGAYLGGSKPSLPVGRLLTICIRPDGDVS
ncbi:hypothetical protein LCGC14_1676030 [marine sediment metagenome]|uniref:Uncharacterized protein n=1 Tax=marine sediment metagenome TaxID=412755 RepID=A0A0F9K5N2_9ZZZZ